MLYMQPVSPLNGDPKEWNPAGSQDLASYEKHRFRVRDGEVQISLYLNEDLGNPVIIAPWTDPEFKTLICSGVSKMVFTWISGTPSISVKSYN